MYSIKQIISVLVLLVLIASCSEEQDTSPRVTEDPDVSDFQGVMNDVVNGAPVVVYSNQKQGIFSVFSAQFQNRTLTFELSSEQFPVKLLDNEGNEWDIFGQGRSDANLGQNLELMDQIVGYWFFFPSFYENIELVNGQRIAGAERPERSEDWLINTRNIQYGSFRDGIRSMDAPTFIRMEGKGIVENTFYSELDVDELVTAIEFNGSYRVYPHRILEYHEIVNDFEDELCHTISYCPLTGTSRAWKSKLNGVLTEFGVSGLLYNNNLILYDRQTESHWSQILDVSVNGSLIGERVVSKNCRWR